jgi:DNA-directed RNA polymerase delta subunit
MFYFSIFCWGVFGGFGNFVKLQENLWGLQKIIAIAYNEKNTNGIFSRTKGSKMTV